LKNFIQKLKRSLEAEEKSQFVNLKGKNFSFAQFMSNSFEFLASSKNPEQNKISRVLGLACIEELIPRFSSYQSFNVLERVSLIKDTYLVLEKISNELSKEEKLQKKEQALNIKEEIFESEVKWIPGVGEKVSQLLEKLGIHTVFDLLTYYPREHLDFSNRSCIKDLKKDQNVTVFAQVESLKAFSSPKNQNLHIIDLVLNDGTGRLSLSKFASGNIGKLLIYKFQKEYPKNSFVLASGRVQLGRKTRFQLANFSLQVFEDFQTKKTDFGQIKDISKIIPNYKLTDGISNNFLRKIISNALERFFEKVSESLPFEIREKRKFLSYPEALREIHLPSSLTKLKKAKERIAYEEFLLIQIPLMSQRYKNKEKYARENLFSKENKELALVEKFLKLLEFDLTDAQRRVFNEILEDLEKDEPMNRLIQGDVGSGKTVVAVLASLAVIKKNQQVAIMAPTEILAEQHYQKIQSWLLPLGIKSSLLIGSQKGSQKKEILVDLNNGQTKVVIGTHALIQENVEFNNLGLVVIDEQHRFGVRQRELLKKKNRQKPVDAIFMTATPIPRTMALALYGNLDLSEIDQLPPGRKAIKTKIIHNKNQKRQVQEFIKKELKAKRQAYIVYPLIEESENFEAKSILEEVKTLEEIYRDFELGVIHGKLLSEEKEKIMQDFKSNKIQILIGTSVIEVGIDIPNASTIVIENAERFGLAQLHQLRGRVGRGNSQSYCFLVLASRNPTAQERLKIMEETQNGFLIAERDLKIRGEGELIGDKQSGVSDFGIVCLKEFPDLLDLAREDAKELMKNLTKEHSNFGFLPKLLRYKLQRIQTKISLLEAG